MQERKFACFAPALTHACARWIHLGHSTFELTLVIIVCKSICTSFYMNCARTQIRMFCPSSHACVCEMDTPRTLSASPPRFNPDLAHFDFCFLRCKPLRLDVRLVTMSQRCSIEHDRHDHDAPEQAAALRQWLQTKKHSTLIKCPLRPSQSLFLALDCHARAVRVLRSRAHQHNIRFPCYEQPIHVARVPIPLIAFLIYNTLKFTA